MNASEFSTYWKTLSPAEWAQMSAYSIDESDEKVLSVNISLYINDDLSWFAGHFPDNPVLPGVVQTHWAGELSKAIFKLDNFQGVNSLKFQSMILPKMDVELVLNYKVEKNSVSFSYKTIENGEAVERLSSGSLNFGEGLK